MSIVNYILQRAVNDEQYSSSLSTIFTVFIPLKKSPTAVLSLIKL